MKLIKSVMLVLTIAGYSQFAHAYCWKEAAQRYQIDAKLLYAIGMTESSMRPNIVSRTEDIGLMGINRSWLTKLAGFGINEQALFEPCTNIMVGAWILSDNFARKGVTWDAVGAYNAACTRLKGAACTQQRMKYANRVYQYYLQAPSLD